MAILSFSMTKNEFLRGNKTVTRRAWSDKHHDMWVRFWDSNKHVHDAYDNIPRAGGSKIGEIQLTERPYKERLADMPLRDLEAEGGMCSNLEEFYTLIGMDPNTIVSVIKFKRVD